jgi:hypothetical protein
VRHSFFWLRTLSNTPYVSMNDVQGPFANYDKEMRFSSFNFVLRSTWANWHNSRQVWNLDELTNQLELTCSLAPTQGTRHGHNHTNGHVQKWKDPNVHEKVATWYLNCQDWLWLEEKSQWSIMINDHRDSKGYNSGFRYRTKKFSAMEVRKEKGTILTNFSLLGLQLC